MDTSTAYEIRPIGWVRSSLKRRKGAPRQTYEGAPDARLEILPDFALGLDGIAAGQDVVVLTHSVGALVVGSLLTIAAVSLLPTVWFPLDRYPVGFLWLFSGLPAAAAAWLLVTAIGRLAPAAGPPGSAMASISPRRRSVYRFGVSAASSYGHDGQE